MKNITKIFIAVVVALVISGIGFFAIKRSATTRTVSYSQPATQEEVKEDNEQQLIEENQQQSLDNQQQSQQQVADQNSDQQKTSTQPKQQEALPSQKQNAQKTDSDSSATDKKSGGNSSDTKGKIVDKFVSWGFQKSSGRKIDTIIVHTTYDAIGDDPFSDEGIIAEWKAAGVAPHYFISRDGTIFHLVEDQNIAWHAGVSKMPDGRTNVNDFSIGVEMANTKDGKFTDAQYSALNQLIKNLKDKYSIKYILGHDDIAPGRKTDPWGMDWSKVDR